MLNTIVAEAIDYLAEELEDALEAGTELEAALRPILQRSYAANKQIVFGGDNYSEEWHAEAEQRGLLNLRATPDALPYLITDDTVTVFSNYGVLSERELESRYEVFLEQYVTKLNIEAETAAAIARTMLLPAAARHLALLLERPAERAGRRDVESLIADVRRRDQGRSRRPTWRRTSPQDDCSSTPSTCATRRDPGDGRASARRPRTSSRRSSPTTSGRCRSTRRSCSSSSPPGAGRRKCGPDAAPVPWPGEPRRWSCPGNRNLRALPGFSVR